MADQLSTLATSFSLRVDVPPQARRLVRLEHDVSALQAFANRSYAAELALQRTVVRDLLGGGGGASLFAQHDEVEACVDAAVARVRAVVAVWDGILARSAWAQAAGALADAVASKIVADVLDMAAIGQDEAYRIAKVIGFVTELDDLFLPSRLGELSAPPPPPPQQPNLPEISQTAHYAPSWLRLKYLSEVMQANLSDVRYLWFESELSLSFDADEVVHLIGLSFEDNERARAIKRDILTSRE